MTSHTLRKRIWPIIGILSIMYGPGAASSLALDIENSRGKFVYRHWQYENGLPHNAVHALAQTKDGYLWCGTESGLARFDGTAFTIFNYSNTAEFKDNSVHSLFVDQLGRLWIGTGDGLLCYSDKKFQRFSTSDGLCGNAVWSLAETPDGSIWIGTFNGLSRYSSNQFFNFSEQQGLPSKFCRSLRVDETGKLWIGTTRGLAFYDADLGSILKVVSEITTSPILSIGIADQGRLWIGTRGNGAASIERNAPSRVERESQLGKSTIQAIYRDGESNIWIGGAKGLVVYTKNNRIVNVDSNLLREGTIQAIQEDNHGNLWVGTSDGLVRISDRHCLTLSREDGLPSNTIWSIFEDRQGIVWIGSATGLASFSQGKITHYPSFGAGSNDTVLSITEDEQGTLWLGTSSGLRRLSGGKFETFRISEDYAGNAIHALTPDRDGSLLVGNGAGDLLRFSRGRFEKLLSGSPSERHQTRAVLKRDDGAVWVGTNGGGIACIRGSEINWFHRNHGLTSNSILCLTEDPFGSIWAGTFGGGLNCFRDGNWSSYSIDGKADDVIYQILVVGQNLWMSTSRGLLRVNNKELTKSDDIRRTLRLSKSDGLPILDFNGGSQPAGCRARDGRLWFPTGRGVVFFDPTHFADEPETPPISIERVVADDVSFTGDGPIHLKPGQSKLEVHFSGLDLSHPEHLEYRFKLLGLDNDWAYAAGRRVAFYTNLPPGDYQFQVTCRNSASEWSERIASIDLKIEPYYYQTYWFYGIAVLLLILVVILFHLSRTRRIRHRERVLATRIQEKTRELKREIEQHAQTSELLRQSQKLEALGQLAGGVAHDFNNLLTVINGYSEYLLSKAGIEESDRQTLQHIQGAGTRAAQLTQQLLAFSRRQVLEPSTVDFHQLVMDTLKLIRRVLSENIELEQQISTKPAMVKIDVAQLQNAIINLVVNARDSMQQGGRITVKTENLAASDIESRNHPNLASGNYVQISIADTGHGIPPEIISRIFEPFFTTKAVGKGSGLGLATVYGFVQQSNGEISVTSELDKGTNFVVTLPIVRGEEPTETTQPSASLASMTGQETILVVEDEPSVRMVICHILEKAGYRLLQTSNGQEASTLAAEYPLPIDLVVTDVVMPELGGRQLAEKIKDIRPSTKILFVSGYTNDEELKIDITDSRVAFLHKPFTAHALLTKIRQTLASQ